MNYKEQKPRSSCVNAGPSPITLDSYQIGFL